MEEIIKKLDSEIKKLIFRIFKGTGYKPEYKMNVEYGENSPDIYANDIYYINNHIERYINFTFSLKIFL